MPIDVVLPIHPAKSDVLDLLRAASGLQSFVTKGSDAAVGRFLVVHPRGLSRMVEPLRAISPKVECVVEDTMFSQAEYASLLDFGGWRRQQFVKLAANRLSEAAAVLTCDADVVAIRTMSEDAVLREGRVLVQKGSQIQRWVQASFALFGAEPVQSLMSVTPAFLSPRGLGIVQERLSRPHRGWVQTLVDAARHNVEWTEYMVYQAGLVAAGMWNELHFVGPGTPINQGIWKRSVGDDEQVAKLAAKGSLFFVHQSTREDFFAAQRQAAETGLPSIADIDPLALNGCTLALARFHEMRRVWAKQAQPTLGVFRNGYHDLMDALICGAPLPDERERFRALTMIWLLAVVTAEADIDKKKFRLTSHRAVEQMRASPLLAPALDATPDFDRFLAYVEGDDVTPPEGLREMLFNEDTSRPLYNYLISRLREHESAQTVLALASARFDAGRAPFRALEHAVRFAAGSDPRAALRFVRRARRRLRARGGFWTLVADVWIALGREDSAARARAREARLSEQRAVAEAQAA